MRAFLTNGVHGSEACTADRAVGPEADPQGVGSGQDGGRQGGATVPTYQRICLSAAVSHLQYTTNGQVQEVGQAVQIDKNGNHC